jgi:hypothetical protein
MDEGHEELREDTFGKFHVRTPIAVLIEVTMWGRNMPNMSKKDAITIRVSASRLGQSSWKVA